MIPPVSIYKTEIADI